MAKSINCLKCHPLPWPNSLGISIQENKSTHIIRMMEFYPYEMFMIFQYIWLGRVFIVLVPFSSFSLWTPTQTVTGELSSKTMTCCYRLIRTVGEWTKSHQLFMAVTTCILNLDKQTNSSNLCLQIVDLKLYGINVPDILQT